MTTTTRTRPAEATALTFDPARSTRWTALYHVPSHTRPQPREVRHDMRDGKWTCSCPAYKECHHIREAREFERARWWSQIVAGMGSDDLYDFALALNGRVVDGSATPDDRLALRAIAGLSGQQAA
jgi:hypothetical protein